MATIFTVVMLAVVWRIGRLAGKVRRLGTDLHVLGHRTDMLESEIPVLKEQVMKLSVRQ